MAATPKIRTERSIKPIRDRNFDWSAVLDGHKGLDPIGHGSTEQQAIDDLLEQLEERK